MVVRSAVRGPVSARRISSQPTPDGFYLRPPNSDYLVAMGSICNSDLRTPTFPSSPAPDVAENKLRVLLIILGPGGYHRSAICVLDDIVDDLVELNVGIRNLAATER